MIYYDNDQFCGEDIYYLQRIGVHQLVLHFFVINHRWEEQTVRRTHLNLMHSNDFALIRTINHPYAMALEFCVDKLSRIRWYPSYRVSAVGARASTNSAEKLISCRLHRSARCRGDLKANANDLINETLTLTSIKNELMSLISHTKINYQARMRSEESGLSGSAKLI